VTFLLAWVIFRTASCERGVYLLLENDSQICAVPPGRSSATVSNLPDQGHSCTSNESSDDVSTVLDDTMNAHDDNVTAKAAAGTRERDHTLGQDTKFLVRLTSEIAEVVLFLYSDSRGYRLTN